MNSETYHDYEHSSGEERQENHTAHSHAAGALPVVEPRLVEEETPENIVSAISQQLHDGEAVFVLFRLNSGYQFTLSSGKSEKVPLWTVITGGRLLLLAISSEDDTYVDVYDQQTLVEYQNGFSRDTIKIADKSLLTNLWEGKRRFFKEAITLFPLPEYEKYLYLADEYLKKDQLLDAAPFLQKSVALVPTIKACLLLVHIFAQHQQRENAIGVIHTALTFTQAASLIEESQLAFPDDIEIQLYLAAAFEEARLWEDCIRIYKDLLQKHPEFELYFLKLGEMYNAKQDHETAITYYQKFITARTRTEPYRKGEFFSWDMANLKWFSADPDLVKAYFDLGLLYEYELNDHERAAATYLALIRQAPFYPDVYKHFWIVSQQLPDYAEENLHYPRVDYAMFLQIYRLLFPHNFSTVVSQIDSGPRDHFTEKHLSETPRSYYRLHDAVHEHLVHQGEKEYLGRIQSWLTTIVLPEDEGQGIEEYCEQVGESNFPELSHTILRIADFLGVAPPRCFISRGKIGISVRNKETPFIFIGSDHLSEENERHFSSPELIFIIASQLEHIKSGHLLITGTELWKSLGTASFDGFLVALQCLPAGSFLGRLTHHFATEGLKKVYKATKYSSLQKIVDLFNTRKAEPQNGDASGRGDAPSLEDRTAGKIESESVLKEQIVDFARHAVYTADRIGLLASHNIEAASSVIFKLAGNAYNEINTIPAEGLFEVLERQDNRGNYLYFEYAKRFNELMKFALSEEYVHVHSKYIVMPREARDKAAIEPNPKESSQYQLFLHKLQILEQSMQNDLLSPEEFLRKHKNLITNFALLEEEERRLLDKLQQAFLDHILTLEEFHVKVFALLETKHEANATEASPS